MLQILIDKLKWMSNGVFLELFALGQCLPGPSSTQVSFALGTVKKGVLGGCEASRHEAWMHGRGACKARACTAS